MARAAVVNPVMKVIANGVVMNTKNVRLIGEDFLLLSNGLK